EPENAAAGDRFGSPFGNAAGQDHDAARSDRQPRLRRRHGGPGGLHPPHPHSRRPRDHPAAAAGSDRRADDRRHHRRPDDRGRMRFPLGFVVRRQLHRWFARRAAPPHRNRRARTAALRGVQPLRHELPLPGGGPAAAVLPAALLRGQRHPVGQPADPQGDLALPGARWRHRGDLRRPPINPDVTIVHAQRADRAGNTQIWGLTGIQAEAVYAAKKAIVVVEEVVPDEVVRSDPNRTVIPAHAVDAVVECPRAAHPSFAQGYYDRDNAFYREWSQISEDPRTLRQWLDEGVHGTRDHAEYVAKLGGERWKRLAVEEAWSQPVNYGRRR